MERIILFRSITERNGLFQGIITNMDAEDSKPLSGRQAEARRNDRLILEAAREVFVEDPDAPISAVAERARVRRSS
jgi:hypothetical protein